ncbi:alpha/beta hydrolase [Actinomadura logoneensis]|uniref:Alpha/beta hydrolase n=1 Tax=Actinomadura logoneensis TaxID=2293572 RepID=A0A372JJC4_9ACTN|nr:alpha/beta hydrolase [Actinomadura logoneensis]RFU39916.1 alpha/beta hydrolase [Actinomadura logoneensis]
MAIEVRHSNVPIGDLVLHVAESGASDGPPFLFLHGWPESWRTWLGVMTAADADRPDARVIAIDLPGIGASGGAVEAGSKLRLAETVHALVERLGLTGTTLVGHDAGGMAAYAYLRRFEDVDRVVVMNTVIPGVDPWDEVLRNPYIWHFGLHGVPDLPETLVHGRQAEYFDYFYNVLSADPSRVSAENRAAHAAAYGSREALTAGFDLYRAFPQDARDNAASAKAGDTGTPLLYLRGDHEGGDIDAYARGFRDAGVRNLATATVRDAGHFSQEEQPATVWRLISDFAESTAP